MPNGEPLSELYLMIKKTIPIEYNQHRSKQVLNFTSNTLFSRIN